MAAICNIELDPRRSWCAHWADTWMKDIQTRKAKDKWCWLRTQKTKIKG